MDSCNFAITSLTENKNSTEYDMGKLLILLSESRRFLVLLENGLS